MLLEFFNIDAKPKKAKVIKTNSLWFFPICILLGSLCISIHSSAATSIAPSYQILTSELREGHDIAEGLEYRTSPLKLSIHQLLTDNDEIWLKTENKNQNFGNDERLFWFRFRLTNDAWSTSQVVLKAPDAGIDFISVYIVRDGALIRSFRTGDKLPFNTRPIKHNFFLFPLNLDKQDSADIYQYPTKYSQSSGYFHP